jgi:hypothetical protein
MTLDDLAMEVAQFTMAQRKAGSSENYYRLCVRAILGIILADECRAAANHLESLGHHEAARQLRLGAHRTVQP